MAASLTDNRVSRLVFTFTALTALAAAVGFFTFGLGVGVVMGLGAGSMKLSKPKHSLFALGLTIITSFLIASFFLPIKMAFAAEGVSALLFAVTFAAMHVIGHRESPGQV